MERFLHFTKLAAGALCASCYLGRKNESLRQQCVFVANGSARESFPRFVSSHWGDTRYSKHDQHRRSCRHRHRSRRRVQSRQCDAKTRGLRVCRTVDGRQTAGRCYHAAHGVSVRVDLRGGGSMSTIEPCLECDRVTVSLLSQSKKGRS